MKEKLKSVKTKHHFLLPNSSFRHRLGFAVRKIRVDRAKDHVSCDETWSFTRRNLTFRAPKPYLSQFRIL
jgi:hypothetical protein